MKLKSYLSNYTCLWLLLIGIMFIRFFFMGMYPLADTTEARYGEMARLIVTTGDWITPQFEKGVPFWGKPPLSLWLTAICFKTFGINEFSARLPSFILSIVVLLTVFSLVYYQSKDKKNALAACVIMASSIIFWISSGAVMTDHCLLTGTTLSMAAFWRCITSSGRDSKLWGWLFFLGLAIGLMAKGPVAVVLIFFPILAWGLIQMRSLKTLKKIPWIIGILTIILLVFPWYIAAEIKTPGFFEYFFIGEHWNRFLVPGWKGDLYGSAHSHPKGMIWIFWMVCALPWSLFFIYHLVKKDYRKSILKKYHSSKDWHLYLLLWAATPMIFFSLAGNILWAYVLPGIPAFAIICATIFDYISHLGLIKRISMGFMALLTLVSIVVLTGTGPSHKSQKDLVYYFNAISQGETLYYFKWRPFSAEFYSQGAAKELSSVQEINNVLKDNKKDYLAMRKKLLSKIPEATRHEFTQQKEIKGYVLLKEK